MAERGWFHVSHGYPPAGVEVETKIHDERGTRNEQTLVYERRLWWSPDRSMYVYYNPTHWRYVEAAG